MGYYRGKGIIYNNLNIVTFAKNEGSGCAVLGSEVEFYKSANDKFFAGINRV